MRNNDKSQTPKNPTPKSGNGDPPAEHYMPPPAPLLALFQTHASFLLFGHENPDGDAVGSALALGHILRDMGKQVSVAFPTPPPDWWTHMPGADMVTQQPSQPPDVAVSLDCDDISRLDHLTEAYLQAPHCAEIDHHTNTRRSCEVFYVDPQASAVGVLIHRILTAMHQPLTAQIGTCIYWAIATDTGFFRFANTNAEALRVCAECVAAGADARRIARATVGNRPLAHLVLKGRALANLKQYLDGRVLLGVVSMQDFAAAGANRTHAEGIIDDIRLAPEADVSVLFKAPSPNNCWQVSLRSSVIDCAEVARRFGGGGHAEAAGFSFDGPLADGRRHLLDALADLLPETDR